MGVKSTVELTRKQAEDKFVDLFIKQTTERQVRALAWMMSNKRLEDELERLNDLANDGEGFENYWITGD